VLAVIKKFPGRWEKNKSGSAMHYTNNDFTPSLRLYAAELPPSCVRVKKTRIEPASPERTVEYEEIMCSVPEKDVVVDPTNESV
jgi:hypothetical protein